jgi:hypothetical protein
MSNPIDLHKKIIKLTDKIALVYQEVCQQEGMDYEDVALCLDNAISMINSATETMEYIIEEECA